MKREAVGRTPRVLASSIAAVMVVLVAGGTPSGLLAQDARPAAGTPVVPDPSECTVPPRSLGSVRAVLGTAMPNPEAPKPAGLEPADPERGEPVDPELGGPPPVPIGVELPAGEPADQATVNAVEATARHFLACLNAGDVLRMYALVSDDFLRQSFAGQPPTEAVLAYFAAPPASRPAEARAVLVGVREARVLPDGRVGALVDDHDPTEPGAPPVSTAFVIFAREGDRYVMDQVIAGLEMTYGPNAGTPAP